MVTPFESAYNNYRTAGNMYQRVGAGEFNQPFYNDRAQKARNIGAAAPAYMQTYGPQDITGYTTRNLNRYVDPYYQQVIQSALGTIEDQKHQNLNQVGAQATSAGAFGGARHGLVEAQVMQDAATAATQTSAQLGSSAFSQALQAMQYDTSQQLSRGLSMSSANQQAELARRSMMQNGYLAGAGLDNGMSQFGTQARTQQALAKANGAANLGSTMYNVGNDLNDRLNRQGAMQQQLAQLVMGQGYNQFNQYLQTPFTSLDLINAAVGNDPRNAAVSQTGTASYSPGLFDWVSLGAQTFGQAMGAGR